MRFLARRFIFTLPILIGVATFSFLLLHLVPGDPVDIILGDQADVIDKANLKKSLGLDVPLPQQYGNFIFGLAHADLGKSLIDKKPVAREIVERFPATFALTFSALFLALLVSLPLGFLCAAYKGSVFDNFCLSYSFLAAAMPSFWSAPMLIWIFALQLDLLPVSEGGDLQHLILPALTLAIGPSGILVQMTRSSLLQVLKSDYIQVARAKGVGAVRLYIKHAAKNAATPLITLLGLQIGSLLTGAVIIETIFDWPGIGSLLFQGIQQRNYPVVQGTVLFIAFIYVMVTTITDLLYVAANPRLRDAGALL